LQIFFWKYNIQIFSIKVETEILTAAKLWLLNHFYPTEYLARSVKEINIFIFCFQKYDRKIIFKQQQYHR